MKNEEEEEEEEDEEEGGLLHSVLACPAVVALCPGLLASLSFGMDWGVVMLFHSSPVE